MVEANKYLMKEKLGEGSFSTVYACRNILTNSLHAVKKVKIKKAEVGLP